MRVSVGEPHNRGDFQTPKYNVCALKRASEEKIYDGGGRA